jgi:hypothetical protein
MLGTSDKELGIVQRQDGIEPARNQQANRRTHLQHLQPVVAF